MPPHPSEIVPHSAPISAQVIGVHPHFFEMPPPPHVAGAVHCPQWIVPPHPSGAVPHSALRSSQVIGRQPLSLRAPLSVVALPPPPPTIEPSGLSTDEAYR